MRKAPPIALLVSIAFAVGTTLLGGSEDSAPVTLPYSAPHETPEASTLTARATSPIATERSTVPVQIPTAPHEPGRSIFGTIEGHTPGFGPAWIVDAFRLTKDRSAVVEQRRVYANPRNGRFTLEGMADGAWQLALVAPRFAWGPIVEVGGERAPGHATIRAGAVSTAFVQLDDATASPARVDVFAIRSPQLTASLVELPHCVATREARIGETLTFEGLPAGDYELVITRKGELQSRALHRLEEHTSATRWNQTTQLTRPAAKTRFVNGHHARHAFATLAAKPE